MLNKKAYRLLANRSILTEKQLRLFLGLLGINDLIEYVLIDPAYIHKNTLLWCDSKRSIADNVRILVQVGLMERGPRIGKQFTYRVSPQYVQETKHTGHNQRALLRQIQRECLMPNPIRDSQIPLHKTDKQRNKPLSDR
jgi:hypothetical protein